MLRAYATDSEEGCSGIPTSGFNLSSDWFMKGMTGIEQSLTSAAVLFLFSSS